MPVVETNVFEQYEYHDFLITISAYNETMKESFAVPTRYSHLYTDINDWLLDESDIDENDDFYFFYEQPFIDHYEHYTKTQYHLDSLVSQINETLDIRPKTIVLKQLYKKSITPKTSKNKRGFHQVAWASMVKLRDGKCTECGSVYDLHAHHIKPYKDYPELRHDVNNGITLCGQCHRKWHKENGK